jgi:RNA polymerase sigma factor (sigma-70 family)
MIAGGSVTRWLFALKRGDPDAARPVWERYSSRVVGLAGERLRRAGQGGAEADAEDVALAAFADFFQGAALGRFPRLDDRGDLWQVLALIARRKAAHLAERRRRLKRGGGLVLDEAALAGAGLDGLAAEQPDPELAAEAAEEFHRLLAILDDDRLRRIALLKLEGYSHEEIGDRLDCSLRSVTLKLALIRRLWADQVPG